MAESSRRQRSEPPTAQRQHRRQHRRQQARKRQPRGRRRQQSRQLAGRAIVDFDRVEGDVADLPGKGHKADSELVQQMQEELLRMKYNQIDPDSPVEELDDFEEWAESERENHAMLDVLNYDEVYETLERIEEGVDPSKAVYRTVARKLTVTSSLLPSNVQREINDRISQNIMEQSKAEQHGQTSEKEDETVVDESDPTTWEIKDPLNDDVGSD